MNNNNKNKDLFYIIDITFHFFPFWHAQLYMFKWISSFSILIIFYLYFFIFWISSLFFIWYIISPLCRFSMHSQLTYLNSPDHEKLYCFKIYGDFESMLTAWRAYNDCFPPFFFFIVGNNHFQSKKKIYFIFMYMYVHFIFFFRCVPFFFFYTYDLSNEHLHFWCSFLNASESFHEIQ